MNAGSGRRVALSRRYCVATASNRSTNPPSSVSAVRPSLFSYIWRPVGRASSDRLRAANPPPAGWSTVAEPEDGPPGYVEAVNLFMTAITQSSRRVGMPWCCISAHDSRRDAGRSPFQ